MGTIKARANGHSNKDVQFIDKTELPPHSMDAEQATLGGIIINPDAYYDVAEFLHPEHFYIGKHATTYKAISDLKRESIAIDLVTLMEVLEGRGLTDTAFLVDLVNAVPTAINTQHYGRIVHSLYMRRSLQRAAGAIATLATDEKQSIGSIIATVESTLHDVTGAATRNNVEAIKDGMSNLVDATQKRQENGGALVGLPTGFIDLDRMLQGLKPQEVITLAGRPGMGKSIMERCIALHVANQGKRVLSFNLEMGRESVWQRTAAIDGRLGLQNLRNGKLSEHDLQQFMESAGRLSELSMMVDDTSSIPISQLSAKARRIHAEHGLDLITIDYMQLVTTDGRYQNRVQEVGEISRAVKRLAKEINVPVLNLAQLSRSCEARADKRPLLSDLRESGDIEQDSDIVMFIYRDDYYNPDDSERPNIAEVNIAKHRNGPTGIIDLYFHGPTARMSNLDNRQISL